MHVGQRSGVIRELKGDVFLCGQSILRGGSGEVALPSSSWLSSQCLFKLKDSVKFRVLGKARSPAKVLSSYGVFCSDLSVGTNSSASNFGTKDRNF